MRTGGIIGADRDDDWLVPALESWSSGHILREVSPVNVVRLVTIQTRKPRPMSIETMRMDLGDNLIVYLSVLFEGGPGSHLVACRRAFRLANSYRLEINGLTVNKGVNNFHITLVRIPPPRRFAVENVTEVGGRNSQLTSKLLPAFYVSDGLAAFVAPS